MDSTPFSNTLVNENQFLKQARVLIILIKDGESSICQVLAYFFSTTASSSHVEFV